MSRPCCIGVAPNAFCGNVTSELECEALASGQDHWLGPEDTECADTGGCWECNPEGRFPDWNHFCFLTPSGVLEYYFTWAENCDRCNPFATCTKVSGPEDCGVPPEPPRNCRTVSEDRAASDGLRWTADLLGTVGFGLDEIMPDSGYVSLLSSELVRARAESPTTHAFCRHAIGELVIMGDGYVYGEVCSQPQWNRPESRRRSYTLMRTAQDTPGMRNGYQYAITAVHLPHWTEVVYRSHKILCEEPER